MGNSVKGGSLGYDVIMARYRQHFLIFNLLMLAIMGYIISQTPDIPDQVDGTPIPQEDKQLADLILNFASGTVMISLGAMAVWQYWMDGYAIKYLRIKEKKLFGK